VRKTQLPNVLKLKSSTFMVIMCPPIRLWKWEQCFTHLGYCGDGKCRRLVCGMFQGSGGLGTTIQCCMVWSVGGNQSIVLHREVAARADRSRTWCVGYLRKKGYLEF
jgi:hypothetical protein